MRVRHGLLGIRFRGAAFDKESFGDRDHRTYFYGSGAFELVFSPERRGEWRRKRSTSEANTEL